MGRTKVFPVSGINVEFPFADPYPAQKQMMSKIIQSLKNKENALLESPTGSGKSLALLCSALAWLQARIEQREKMKQPFLEKKNALMEKSVALLKTDKNAKNNASKYFQTQPQNELNTTTQKEQALTQIYSQISALKVEEAKALPKIPKIYYGTRTHRQVKQIVKELSRTKYNNVKMTILGSRDHYCVNQTAKKFDRGVNEGCSQLLRGTDIGAPNIAKKLSKDKSCKCAFRNNMKQLTEKKQGEKSPGLPKTLPYTVITKTMISSFESWDIEDLVKGGNREGYCPYFVSKAILNDVEIVFCPYNYLIERTIRDGMEIRLDGQIVIFDEAHNLEDISRAAASVDSQASEKRNLEEAIVELNFEQNSHNNHGIQEALGTLKDFLDDVVAFLDRDYVYVRTGQTYKSDQHTILEFDKLTPEQKEKLWLTKSLIDRLKTAYNVVTGAGPQTSEPARNPEKAELPSRSKAILSSFLSCYEYIYRKPKNSAAFRILVMKEEYDENLHKTLIKTNNKSRSMNEQRKGVPEFYHELQILCMSPAIAFNDFSRCHSILLASGTLSPLDTFESELEIKFRHKLEANHVIRPEQVFCRYVPRGKSGILLNNTYKNRSNEKFVEELGELIVDTTSKVVKGGILVFFSSYAVMNSQIKQWKTLGIFGRLKKLATVVSENSIRGGDFNKMLTTFNDTCKVKRSVLFAVCRGKISEGIDFADSAARVVMAIGIPYPAYKSPSTKAKRDYNDLVGADISGSRWYDIQAFRAINQALGRCLRHSEDWGAILLVDDRWEISRYLNDISKWLRRMALPSGEYEDFLNDLQFFQDKNQRSYDRSLEEVNVKSSKYVVEPDSDTDEEKENKPVFGIFKRNNESHEVDVEDEDTNLLRAMVAAKNMNTPLSANEPNLNETPGLQWDLFMKKDEYEYENHDVLSIDEDSSDHISMESARKRPKIETKGQQKMIQFTQPSQKLKGKSRRMSNNGLTPTGRKHQPMIKSQEISAKTYRSLSSNIREDLYVISSDSGDELADVTMSDVKMDEDLDCIRECECGTSFRVPGVEVSGDSELLKYFKDTEFTGSKKLYKIKKSDSTASEPDVKCQARYDPKTNQAVVFLNCKTSSCDNKFVWFQKEKNSVYYWKPQ